MGVKVEGTRGEELTASKETRTFQYGALAAPRSCQHPGNAMGAPSSSDVDRLVLQGPLSLLSLS